MSYRTLVILNIVTTLGMIAVNVMANTLPINGMNTGQLSALYPNEFVPAGYTFSIWLLIYILLAGHCIYQLSGFRQDARRKSIEKIGGLFMLTNVLNASWIFAWHYRQVTVSVLIMIALLLTLITIHLRTPIPDVNKTMQHKLWVQVPFSVYLGWIMTAMVANITAFLVDKGWDGQPLTGASWAIIMIAVAGLLSLLILFTRRNTVIPFVTVWSIGGIIMKQRMANGFNNIAVAGAITCSILLLAVLVTAYRRSSIMQPQ